MGDRRYQESLVRVRDAKDRARALADMSFDGVVLALGAASREGDPYLANILTSELLNRSRRGTALVFSAALGVAASIVLFFMGAAFLTQHPHEANDHVFLVLAFVALLAGALGAALVRSPILHRLMRRGV